MEALCVLLSYGIMVEDYGISPLVGFGDPPAQAGARHVCDCLRIAPGSPDWQSGTLLLRYNRLSQKEQTPSNYSGHRISLVERLEISGIPYPLSLCKTKNPTRFLE